MGSVSRAQGSNMWPVVVLGIITAVLAWIWFGGRGENRGEEQGTGPGTQLSSLQEEPESEDSLPHKTPDNEPALRAGQVSLSHDTATQLDKLLNAERDEGYGQGESSSVEGDLVQDQKGALVQDQKGDACHLPATDKEGVHARQDPLQQSNAEAHHSMGEEEQVGEDPSPSGEGLVGLEEHHPSIGGQETQVTAEDLKPPTVTAKKLVQTRKEENDFIVPAKVVPVGADTSAMHPNHVQDDGGTLVNGSEEQHQKDNGTVCLQGNVANGNALNVTISPIHVDSSASENNFDQYDHNKLDSCEQSELDLAVNEKPLVTLEKATCAQVDGHITNHVSPESCHAEVGIAQNSEDVILTNQTSPVEDKCVFLHSSNQEEESNDFKWTGSSDNSCFATHSEAKLHDDPQRTKRVAAVQPIPQNVSLGFKVHYITQSDSQLIAVIGDHEKLGEWETYVPLSSDKDGIWSHSVTLPADANVEWKFVMVEDGKIKRWEECYNRHLRTAHEDLATQQWWGYP